MEDGWRDQAACIGKGHLFFAPFAERPQTRVRREARARAVCSSCPVLDPCRRYARRHREYGVWGGENEDEREQVIGLRRQAAGW